MYLSSIQLANEISVHFWWRRSYRKKANGYVEMPFIGSAGLDKKILEQLGTKVPKQNKKQTLPGLVTSRTRGITNLRQLAFATLISGHSVSYEWSFAVSLFSFPWLPWFDRYWHWLPYVSAIFWFRHGLGRLFWRWAPLDAQLREAITCRYIMVSTRVM